MEETRTRSIVKTLSWRITATFITAIVALVVTGEIGIALTVGAFDTTIKLVIGYFHERVWANINFGRPKAPPPPPEYQI